MITINTNYTLINHNDGKATVQYYSNQLQGHFTLQTVDFIPQNQFTKVRSSKYQSVVRKTATRLQQSDSNQKGVLYSMSEAIYNLLNAGNRNIIATVAIQSRGKLSGEEDTLKHFERIFRDVYNTIENKPIEAKLEQLAQKVKHIFIAIDEITGDRVAEAAPHRSGVEFLLGISQLLKRYGLSDPNYFNTKIIVADASIINVDIIQQHLSDKIAEPNKIFFRKAPSINACLTTESFTFNQTPAIAINTNSYPANKLHITYKTLIQSLKFQQKKKKIYATKKFDLEQQTQTEIINDLETILLNFPQDQVIVYIQDKTRLTNLIKTLQSNRIKFIPEQDYIEIHADCDQQKAQIYKDQVQVIFMTASASRGLSFPRVKHILIDLPRFEIEANLMEVIQVIYRGRGNPQIDREDKYLIFYLNEQAVYYLEDEDDRKYSLQESKLNVLNFLIILHVSIKTRIYGYGNIAEENYMMIPVGGKSIFSAGESLSNKIKTLIKSLKKEYRQGNDDLRIQQAFRQLEELMKTTDITIYEQESKTTKLSYLKLLDDFRLAFLNSIDGNLNTLLNFSKIQTGYVL
ncbi:helicase-like protein [Chondrocystis sp. NIES-4102]|nr:helicase-like protein [Chondrocystis sp. NIES-4102]